VDSSEYGPQVHAIHRVIRGLPLSAAVDAVREWAMVDEVAWQGAAVLAPLNDVPDFAAVLTDGRSTFIVVDRDHRLTAEAERPGEPAALAELDVTVVHRALVERVWRLTDDVDTVGYAHTVDDALTDAAASAGTAVLLRPTPVAAVAAVAAAGARMPRKSTLFTPKPASGLVMRRLADQRG
jgi:hypothetical protein